MALLSSADIEEAPFIWVELYLTTTTHPRGMLPLVTVHLLSIWVASHNLWLAASGLSRLALPIAQFPLPIYQRHALSKDTLRLF